MKATELRLGNWVIGDAKIEYQLEIDDFADWYNDHNSHTYGDFVHPIPLTEEWLMKFEFEKHPTKDYYYHDCGEYVIRVVINAFSGTIDNDSSWFISIETGFASQPVTLFRKYVHQLQNLYHALTGEEL